MRLLHAWASILLAVSATAGAVHPAVEDEAKALKGIEYTAYLSGGQIAPQKLTCTDEGGGLLDSPGASSEVWAFGIAHCQGRTVLMLKQAVGKMKDHITWRIVDTMLLPPFEADWDPTRPHALRSASMEECELDGGRTDTFFMALVRWGKNERIDWRNGVEQAWTFDIPRGRITSLSIKRIVCEWFEP